MVTVVAQMIARDGQEKFVREQLLSLVAPSRKDKGCLNYDLHESQDSPGTFLFHENWESKEDLDAHLEKPHVQKVLGTIGSFLAEQPQITLWDRLSP